MTHHCVHRPATNHIVKFADDTTVVGLIRDNDHMAYREEVEQLVDWCRVNILNVDKTKEIIVDFRKNQPSYAPLFINNTAVEVVNSTKFLGVHITDTLTRGLMYKDLRGFPTETWHTLKPKCPPTHKNRAIVRVRSFIRLKVLVK